MAVTPLAGIFGWGLNTGGAKGSAPSTWYRHRSSGIDLGVLDDVRVGPPEIGGIPTPTFPYKAGYLISGGAGIFPRLEDTIGTLFLGLMGDAAVDVGEDIDGSAVAGLNHHTFKYKSTATEFVPYMGFRKLVPHPTPANRLGETYADCKMAGMTLSLPNDGPIATRVDALGIDFAMDDDPSWTWDNTFEDYHSIPIGVETGGSIKFTPEGESEMTLKVVGATVSFANVPAGPREDRIFGSPKLEEVTILSRALTFDLIVKYEDPELYLTILTNSATGTAWAGTPFVGEVVVTADSQSLIGSAPLDLPWRIRITGQSVNLQQVGGLTLAPNQSILMRLAGTAIAPASGEYATIEIQNEHVAAYALPV